MTSVVRFLEGIARSGMPHADYDAAVAALPIDEQQRSALLHRDSDALNDLLGGRRTMFFGVLAPEEQPFTDEPPLEDVPEEFPDEQARAA
jgi:hypothetical protein